MAWRKNMRNARLHLGKKIISRFLLMCGIVVVFIIITIFAFPFMVRYETTSLSDLVWKKAPSIIAIKNERFENAPAILALRIKDEQKRYFVGSFNVSFTDNNNAVVFGDNGKTGEDKLSKVYYIEDGRKITDIAVKRIRGTINSVQENPLGTYLFIEIKNERSTNFCVIERISDLLEPSCKDLALGEISKGVWNPQKKHELVVLTKNGALFTYDPWDKKPYKVYEEDAQRFNELKLLFSKKPLFSIIKSDNGDRRMIRFLTAVFIIDGKRHIRIFSVPLFSKVAWFNDNDHVIIKERGELSIVELSSRKRGVFQQINDLAQKIVVYRLNGFDIQL